MPAWKLALWTVDHRPQATVSRAGPKATKATVSARSSVYFVALAAELDRPALDPAPAARALIFARVGDRLADAAHVGVGTGRGEDDAEPGVVFRGFAQRHIRAAGELRLDRARLVRRPIDVGAARLDAADARTGGQARSLGADHHRARRDGFARDNGGVIGGRSGLAARGERGGEEQGEGRSEALFHAPETSRRGVPAQRSSPKAREPHFRLGFRVRDPI